MRDLESPELLKIYLIMKTLSGKISRDLAALVVQIALIFYQLDWDQMYIPKNNIYMQLKYIKWKVEMQVNDPRSTFLHTDKTKWRLRYNEWFKFNKFKKKSCEIGKG